VHGAWCRVQGVWCMVFGVWTPVQKPLIWTGQVVIRLLSEPGQALNRGAGTSPGRIRNAGTRDWSVSIARPGLQLLQDEN